MSSNARQRAKEHAEQDARRRKERRLLLIVAAALVVLVVIGGVALQAWRTGKAPEAVNHQADNFASAAITAGKPIRLGKAGAPVTITLYEDFHCPHCAEFEEAFGPTITEAQNAGRVAVELYPMSFIDEGSATAANAMACAADAGFGQAYYLGLFANHTLQWSDDQLIDLAPKVGGSATDGFKTCVTGKAHADWVASINAAAESNNVTGTPTMFVDGKSVDFATLTVDSLKTMISQAAG